MKEFSLLMVNRTQLAILSLLMPSLLLMHYWICRNTPLSFFYTMDMDRVHASAAKYRRQAIQAINDIRTYMQKHQIAESLFSKMEKAGLCVGIMTVERLKAKEERYLSQALAALLTRTPLTSQKDVDITVFNLDAHPEAFQEVQQLKDMVRVYTPDTAHRNVRPLVKQLHDYITTAKTMLARQECGHILILEDDAIACHDWHRKIQDLLKQVDGNWMFVKLFAPLAWMGWEIGRDNSIIDVLKIAALALIFAILIHAGTAVVLWKHRLGREWAANSCTKWLLLFSLGAICVITYGKQNFWIRPRGLHAVDTGAASVALLWNRPSLEKYINYIDGLIKDGSTVLRPIDLYPRNYCREKEPLVMYANNPDLFQHVGLISSFSFKRDMTKNDLCWSFNFEDDSVDIKFLEK